ncbi:MAG: hypothetical protein QXL82_02215 [Candidatus Aenigmatarchaeota archaeon]
MINVTLIKLYKGLERALFEEESINIALQITEEIEKYAESMKISLTEIKRDVFKSLFGIELPYEKVPSSSLKTIVSTIHYLNSELGLEKYGVAEVARKFPALFMLDAESIDKRVQYLKSLGLENNAINKIVKINPKILVLDIETMKEKIKYLESLGVKNIARVIKVFPSIFGYSLKYLKAKVDFFKQLGYTQEEIAKEIERNPTMFSSSLKTVVARTLYAISKGYKLKSLSNLTLLIQLGDVKYIGKLRELGYKVSLIEYEEFKKK